MEHTKGLNEAQKEAVCTTEGPVLVLAGAGAGKTRTIAHRIVHLVKKGVAPRHILAITFTNKAAREMRERVQALLAAHGEGNAVRDATVLTFHALAVQLLREFAHEAGVPKYFTIADRGDSLHAVKRAMREVGIDEKELAPRMALGTISRMKADVMPLARYREEADDYYGRRVAEVWERYQTALRKDGVLDFDDLLFELWSLLGRNQAVRERLTERYRYLHVDEYQDTNKVQYELVRFLAGERRNLFCVGDLDQNVYSWRGSTIENILEFERTFPDAAVLRLEQNYRSTQTIVAVSNDIIKKNMRRKDKTLFTTNPEGDKLKLLVGYDEHHEADSVAAEAEALMNAGTPPHDIAVLYRANFQSRVLEEAFLTRGIPYRVLGTRFFDRKEVKDVLAYVRAAQNPASRADIERVINSPLRGIGKVTVERLMREGRDALSGKAHERVNDFYAILDAIQARASAAKASEVLAFTIERSGIGQSLKGMNEEDRERLLNVRELVSLAANRYDDGPAPNGLLRLVEDAVLATDQDEMDRRTERTQGGVTLMTVHAAKGLEFAHVFVAGVEDGLFPHEPLFGEDAGRDDEEERRLFYVALTRAKERVHLSYAQVRTVFGERAPRMPSEFLLDIDEAYLEVPETLSEPTKVVYLD